MAWSPNLSNGKGTEFAPFIPGPSHHRLKGVLVLSGVFHLLLGFVALVVTSHQGRPPRLDPVTVVNLIGGGEFPRIVEKAAPPKEPSGTEPAGKDAATVKAPPPAKRDAKDSARDFAKKKANGVAAPGEFSTSKKKAPPDMSSVSERLRQMREARADSDSVRRAVETRRGEAAARDAVRGVGERVARRIESPSGQSAHGAGGFGGGSQGTARVSPELLEFFRKLEERVRESWVLPEALARTAGKLMVEVRIVIEKDGRVSDTRIVKGSGNVYFDESVRRAIRKASPLPVPPERLRGGEDHYEVGFRFHGTGGE